MTASTARFTAAADDLHGPAHSDAERAAWLLALDPGLGGLVLRGPADAAREHVVQTLRRALPADAPWRRLPAQVDDQRLLGGLDLARSLAAGRPVSQPGLLAEVDQGVLILPMAERLPAALAARLCAALDQGHVAVRETAGIARPARCAMVALDEGLDADETLCASLLDRLALVVVMPLPDRALPHRLRWPEADTAGSAPPPDLADARQRLARLPLDETCLAAFCRAALALGLPSLRAPLQAWRAACAAAALAGHATVQQEDAELAARLVIAPRARQLPQAEAEGPPTGAQAAPVPSPADGAADGACAAPAETPSPPPPAAESAHDAPQRPSHAADRPDPQPGPPASREPPSLDGRVLDGQVLDAARAAIPAGLLAQLAGAAQQAAARHGLGAGRARQKAGGAPACQGRPLPSRRGLPGGQARLDVLQTLRAAIPWQRLRQPVPATASAAPAASSPPRLVIRREDFHVRRHQRPQTRTTVFAVDASGSQALHRLAEAKGAVELLLAECYVRRDRVALIAFRGEQAETLLLPTRSLVRAKRCLGALPGGGGTPLAAGLAAARALGLQVQQGRESGQALLVFLTDARANIALDGTPGRERAMDDALHAARALRAAGLPCLLIDTSPRPQPGAAALAQAMAGRYLALPHGDARAVHAAVRAVGEPAQRAVSAIPAR